MSNLSLRMRRDHDEQLDLLCEAWGVNRSTAARRAIEESAGRIVERSRPNKMQLLRKHGLIGAYSEGGEKSAKERYSDSLRRKYDS